MSRVDVGYDMTTSISSSIYHTFFSLRQVCLCDIVCGVKVQTDECSECGDMGFLPRQKMPYPSRDLVIWVFCPGKKAVSPT